ncbi:MAG: SWIM zinc finger family protein [Roseiflexaceae bacterium]|nr:SWIM zinc finger family protein [Roseiflexaceae bacterium]
MLDLPDINRIRAFAGDEAAFRNGQSVARPDRWINPGQHEAALWGEYRGSGATPYRVFVALDDLTAACSCPSRKTPCKHAVGLVLLAVQHPTVVSAAAPPAWVQDRLARRTTQSDASEKSRSSSSGSSTAATQRTAQREQRAADGLGTLERWLEDVLSRGLLALRQMTSSEWEDCARRLIDAQLPGVARMIRTAAQSCFSGDLWAERLVWQLARIHLLIRAFRRLNALPAGAQSEVRTALGWTMKQEEVHRHGETWADAWLVVAQTLETDERTGLRTQRNWLLSSAGRIALVLYFAPRSQPFGSDLTPGMRFYGELAYFPAAFPLRALILQRTSANADAVFAQNGMPDGATMLEAYADALGRTPWLEAFPTVIRQVTVSGDANHWWLIDATNRALPLAIEPMAAWKLLSFSGGEPVTTFGLWDGFAFAPLTAWDTSQRMITLTASARIPLPTSPLQPPDLLRLAHQGWHAVADPGSYLRQSAEAGLRDFGGALLPEMRPAFLPAPVEPRPDPPYKVWRTFETILGTPQHPLLDEALTTLADRNMRAPPHLTPVLLEYARQDARVRDLVRRVVGARGDWLGRINPEWTDSVVPLSPDQWTTGRVEQRVHLLQTLRRTDPALARQLLLSTWSKDSARARMAFVQTLAVGLSDDDEPLLEACLTDARSEVRDAARDLLVRLPQSAFVQRMWRRAQQILHLHQAPLHLSMETPDSLDADAARDGLVPATPGEAPQRIEPSVLAAAVVSSVPPSFWVRAWHLTPDQLIELARGSAYAMVMEFRAHASHLTPAQFLETLIKGWTAAALRARDADWALALLNFWQESETPLLDDQACASLIDLLSPEMLADLLLPQIERFRSSDQVRLLFYLALQSNARWLPALAQAAFEMYRTALSNVDRGWVTTYWFTTHLLRLALKIPPEMIEKALAAVVSDGIAIWGDAMMNVVELLTLRRDIALLEHDRDQSAA